jgi:transposase
MLAKRNLDLARARTRTCCRLHAVLCELVPGGITKEMAASKAAELLKRIRPANVVEVERKRIAHDLLDDLRRHDRQLKAVKTRIGVAVSASDTTLTELFGVGPVVACTVIGYAGDLSRFATRHRFAAYNGTAPIEVSSGGRVRHRLSRRGNRRLNHAIHIVAVTQIRHRHSEGRAFFERKLAEGKTKKEALRALKRRISDTLYRQLRADALRRENSGPGRTVRDDSKPAWPAAHPDHRLFDEVTPGPDVTVHQRAQSLPPATAGRARAAIREGA